MSAARGLKRKLSFDSVSKSARQRTSTNASALTGFSWNQQSTSSDSSDVEVAIPLLACPIRINQAIYKPERMDLIRSLGVSIGLQDIFILEEGTLLLLHGTAAAIFKALYRLPDYISVDDLDRIDISALKQVRGCRSPSPSPEPEQMPESTAQTYTYSVEVHPRTRGAILGVKGSGMKRMRDKLHLPTYPVLDDQNLLCLSGTENQLKAAIEFVNEAVCRSVIGGPAHLGVGFDRRKMVPASTRGMRKDWKLFMFLLNPDVGRELEMKGLPSLEWLNLRFGLAEAGLEWVKGQARLHVKGSEKACSDLVNYLHRRRPEADIKLDSSSALGDSQGMKTKVSSEPNKDLHRLVNPHKKSKNWSHLRYKMDLPLNWSKSPALASFRFVHSIRRQSHLRFTKPLALPNRGAHRIMLYGDRFSIETAVELLNACFCRHVKGYKRVGFDEKLLEDDSYDLEDPACSWFRG